MMYKQWLAACSLVALLLSTTYAADGDTIAASDFRSGTQNWTLQGAGFSSAGLQSEGDAIAGLDDPTNPGKLWYYAAPKLFLGGDKTLAYNGWLTFNLGHYEYESMGEGIMAGYDVYLYSKNKKLTLGLKGVFKVDDNHLSQTYNVRLVEDFSPADTHTNWELVNVVKPVDGKLYAKPPTQHEFVSCLQSLTGISIRGSYFKGSEATWLKDVKILQGPLNKGGLDGEVQTLIQGSSVSGPASAPPPTTSDCCASRTCVSNDKYELEFDRPGCMNAPDMYCCMSGSSMSEDTCTRYTTSFEDSKAAEIIRGTDYNEGRAFILPTQVDRCKGEGKGQYGSKFAACTDGTAGRRASWDTATKNQNMGLKGIPITKPFIKDYYLSSVPRICSAATLTVEAHGDLADGKDSIMVYGEDDVYLGTLFAGNLTYMKQGQQPYDPSGPGTECDGIYDENIPGTDVNARLADPHHPSGNRPRENGYRGGRNDVVTPGVYGNEDTRCKAWQKGGPVEPSLQTSESTPYKDSIAISQNRMIQYTADEQIKFTFRSVRDDSAFDTSIFSGTGGGGSTIFCSFGTGATDCGSGRCEGCDLDGKVIFRSIKLRFSAGVCYTRKAATDVRAAFEPSVHSAQPLRLLVSYSVPSGENGAPGGDAAVSVTVGADIFGLDKYISVFDTDLNKIGDLFRKESQHTLRSHMEADFMVRTTSFGATDAPRPFYESTDCDTTSPILVTDKCTKPDNQWKMTTTLVNYTDTLLIPRAKVASMAKNGVIQFYIGQEATGNAFSASSEGTARFSPITMAYPLMHCFQKAIKRGPNFGIYLDRPMAYYFKEGGFPMPAGDVSFFIAASWQNHVRYVHRRIGAAITNAGGSAYAYDGMEDGLPAMRVDKDTVGDMGTRWVYKNVDGNECCPATHRPDMADGEYLVQAYSNCIGGTCKDPNEDTTDDCTEETPCATSAVVAGTSTTELQLAASEPAIDNVYNGMKIWITAGLDTGTVPATVATQPVGCTDGTYALIISGGGCTGVAGTWTVLTDNIGLADMAIIAAGTGCYDLTAVTVRAQAQNAANLLTNHGCTTLPVFTSTVAIDPLAGAVTPVGTPGIISTYDGTFKTVTLSTAVSTDTPTTSNQYRIGADGVTDWDSRNGLDGGTSTGSVAVKLDPNVPCESRNIQVGTVRIFDGTSRIRLDSSASATNGAYNQYKVRVGAGTGTDIGTINSYIGTVRGSIASATDASNFVLDTNAEATANIYNDVVITVDLDGDDTTGDDVFDATITAYTLGKQVTVGTALGRTPTTASTYIIYTRMATLIGALATSVTFASDFASNSPDTVGAVASIGDLEVTLGTAAAATLDLYTGMTVVFTHSTTGVVQTRKLKTYSLDGASKTAYLDQPLTSALDAAATYLIYRDYEIYYDLGRGCLSNVDVRISYTIGFAKTISNDPGELLEIYSVWDGKAGRSATSSTEIVKSWVLKLAGDGYYNNIYAAQGVGSFEKTTLTAAAAATDRVISVASIAGIIPGIYLHISDNEASPNEEVVLVTAVVGLDLTVTRAQLNSYAVSHVSGAFVTGPAGSNLGQGQDEMANFGGINRPSATTDDAYTGLKVAIEFGTGAGQTRDITSYHGESRTVYVNAPWNIIPDETSRYRIYYTSEIQSFDDTSFIAIVTLPRPVKKDYLYKVFWHRCATDIPSSVGAATISAPNNDGLPQCNGVLGIRIPKQGEPTIYKRLAPLHTRYVSGVIAAASAADQFTLDDHADTDINEYIGRTITLSATLPLAGNVLAVVSGGSGCVLTAGNLIFSGGGGSGAAGTYTAAAGVITGATLTSGGYFYTSFPTVTVSDTACVGYTWNWVSLGSGTLPVTGANALAVTADSNTCQDTSGYLNFAGGGGSGAAGTYTSAGGGAGIATVTLTSGGYSYTTFPTVTVSDTMCTGVTFNWATVPLRMLANENAAIGERRTIQASTSGRVVKVDTAFSATPVVTSMQYRIDPAPGMSKKTTVSNGEIVHTYIAEEVDVIREEYPEMIAQHKEWPHGYSYMQLKAGENGEHLGNLFLKDYTQYSTGSYYLDEVTIPRSVFENYIRTQPNGVKGEFPFTIKTPPGRSNIEIHSIVIGYPVASIEDATTIEDETEISTSRKSSHGPPPFFPHTPSWTGADLHDRVAATHPRFRSHHYTSTCGNGVHDDGEYCDDGNEVDGDGCSSACSLEAGWLCETFSLGSPSSCTKGAVGARLPDQEVGCKYYACELRDGSGVVNPAYLRSSSPDRGPGVICSGTTKDSSGYFPVCLDTNGLQGTCTLCVTWDKSDNGLPQDSSTPGFAGAWLRR